MDKLTTNLAMEISKKTSSDTDDGSLRTSGYRCFR